MSCEDEQSEGKKSPGNADMMETDAMKSMPVEPISMESEPNESEYMEPLVHPVPSMQVAFDESMIESTEESDEVVSLGGQDAQSRRYQLLECEQYDDSWTTRWKQMLTAQCHPLLKLMAQIVFGMHLLQQQQAKSGREVVKILQDHVNDVDTFLENTSEDFDVAIKDIEDRAHYLKLPMTHMEVFEIMLDDKKFRTQLLEGNEKIETIIDRTRRAMNAALHDVAKGALANKELGRYMKSVQDRWPVQQRSIWEVFKAMKANEQGWRRYFRDLQTKATNLARLLERLHRLIRDMSRMAAAASRRNKTQSSSITPESKLTTHTSGPVSKFSQELTRPVPTQPHPRFSESRNSNLDKPLPQEPSRVFLDETEASATLPQWVAFQDRYESPRESPPDPGSPQKTSDLFTTTSPRLPSTLQNPYDLSATTSPPPPSTLQKASDLSTTPSPPPPSTLQRPSDLSNTTSQRPPSSLQKPSDRSTTTSPPPPSTLQRPSDLSTTTSSRPKTAGEARAADARVNPNELLNFFQRPDPLRSNPNPLRSNPPDEPAEPKDDIIVPQRPFRSQSHDANLNMGIVAATEKVHQISRKRSQEVMDILTIPAPAPVDRRSIAQANGADKPASMLSDTALEDAINSSPEAADRRAAMSG